MTFISDYGVPGGVLGKAIDRVAVQRAMEKGVSQGLENLKRRMEEV